MLLVEQWWTKDKSILRKRTYKLPIEEQPKNYGTNYEIINQFAFKISTQNNCGNEENIKLREKFISSSSFSNIAKFIT